ncbi:HPr family phosphocarrier protein [Shouchella shacheensis]|uniref:HPr family phosphocarrier protein n=1 Tax=Shouchella shacheensis TaxID=1649580 RepID=UPI000740456B|nr:HPr family phosphocarrier protein [Shouchella shacheensis]
MEINQEIVIHIDEEQTIVELSDKMQAYDSEIYLKKMYRGVLHEINLKSLLGLITIHLGNGDEVLIRVVGHDADLALQAVVDYLT